MKRQVIRLIVGGVVAAMLWVGVGCSPKKAGAPGMPSAPPAQAASPMPKPSFQTKAQKKKEFFDSLQKLIEENKKELVSCENVTKTWLQELNARRAKMTTLKEAEAIQGVERLQSFPFPQKAYSQALALLAATDASAEDWDFYPVFNKFSTCSPFAAYQYIQWIMDWKRQQKKDLSSASKTKITRALLDYLVRGEGTRASFLQNLIDITVLKNLLELGGLQISDAAYFELSHLEAELLQFKETMNVELKKRQGNKKTLIRDFFLYESQGIVGYRVRLDLLIRRVASK